MPSDQSIPADIIEVIVQALAVERDKHISANDATLRACTLVSRAFYWPATRSLFRTVSLPMYPYTGIGRNLMRNNSLNRFRAITRANTSLLGMIHNLSIEINTDCATAGEDEEIWTILEEIAHHSLNLQSVSIVGKPQPLNKSWRWMQHIKNDAHKILFTQILQKPSVKSLHLHNVIFDPSLNAVLPLGLSNIQHISFIGVHFAQYHNPGLTTPIHEALSHITSATIQVKVGHDPLPDAIIQLMASWLFTLEIAYTLSVGSLHTWRADFSTFPRLRHLRIREPIDSFYLSNTPLSFDSMYMLSQTGIETMTLSYRLASPEDRATLSRSSYTAWRHSIKFGHDKDLVFLSKRSTWKALHLEQLRQSHPNLRRLAVLLEIYTDCKRKETSFWGYNRDILASQLEENIKDSITGGLEEGDASATSCSVSVTVDLIVAQTM